MVKYQRSPQWIYRPLGVKKQGLLIPLIGKEADLNSVVQLNESAALIWTTLQRPLTLVELLNALEPSFREMSGLDENWHAQVHSCLESMAQERVVETLA